MSNDDDIVYIQLSFRKLDVKLLTDFKLDKSSIVNDKMTSKEVDLITSTSNVPVSSLGTPLKVDFVDNLITFIYVTINNETFWIRLKVKQDSFRLNIMIRLLLLIVHLNFIYYLLIQSIMF